MRKAYLLMRSIFGWFSLALLVVGCASPVYQQQLRLVEPSTPYGQNCVGICSQGREQCLTLKELEYANCRRVAQSEYELCLARENVPVYAPSRKCYLERCERASEESCDDDFRECFIDCGGKIVEEEVCTANCP